MTNKYEKPPKDLGVVVHTKEEQFWHDIKKGCELDIEKLNKMLKFQNAVLELAIQKLK